MNDLTMNNAHPAPLITLDERGLPRGCCFDPAREITPREVKARLDAKRSILLIDCRQPHEWDLTRIDGAILIPLADLPGRLGELEGSEDREIIVYCRSGSRSLKFLAILEDTGFNNIRSMAGGVNLWNLDIAPGNPIY